MSNRRPAICALLCLCFLPGCKKKAAPPAPASQPATTTASTRPAATAPVNYLALARLVKPAIAATQPLVLPLALREALHITLTQPIYVCSRGDLWITAPGAPPLEQIISGTVDEQSHVTCDRVLYVHWAPDSSGNFRPMAVRASDNGNPPVIIDAEQRRELAGASYHWDRAVSVNERIIVPTNNGISVIVIEPGYAMKVLHQALPIPQAGAIESPVRFVFDAQGMLVWAPWENGKRGSDGAIRLVGETFSALPREGGWSDRPLHLVPLLDGSVLELSLADDGTLALKLMPLGAQPVNEQEILQLVEQLSDLEAQVREKAFQNLMRFGPGAWPVLEKILPDQPAGAAVQIEQLLANRTQPTLGGMKLIDGKVQVASWLEDGGLLLFAPSGVQVPHFAQAAANEAVVAPAWIVMRPGRPVHLLNDAMTKDAEPGKTRFYAIGDEWIVSDATQGPRRLLGNHVAPLLRADEKIYQHVVAIDQRGRWLFRESPDATQTLVLDPTIPDPTPRLPVWLMWVKQGTVGWDNNDWPAIKSGGAWVLEEKGWQPLDESKNAMISALPTPVPGGASATAPTSLPSQPPLLIDSKNNRYYDGRLTLLRIASDGQRVAWALPLNAAGSMSDKPFLVADKSGTLFLMNQPGRILRITPTPGAAEPYRIDATFTHRVPSSMKITRMWLDPAGRIAIAYDKNRLAILFAEGHIPPEIATMIPANELE